MKQLSSIDELIGILQSPDTSVEDKINGIKNIGYSKNIRGLEHIVDLLDDENAQVRSAAIWAIGKYKDKSVIPNIVPMVKDPDDMVRQVAIKTLSKFNKMDDVLEAILKLLDDEDPNIRLMILDAILDFESDKILDYVIERVEKDDSNTVKLRAIEILGDFLTREEKSAGYLIGKLESSDDFELQMAIIDQLAKIDHNIREFLILSLKGRRKLFIDDPLTQDEMGVDLTYRRNQPLVMRVRSFNEEIEVVRKYIQFLKEKDWLLEE